jgi:hypothetical protein
MQVMKVIIKREKKNTYMETDTIYNESGKPFAMQQNLNVRNRFGAKNYKYNNKILNVIEWKRI